MAHLTVHLTPGHLPAVKQPTVGVMADIFRASTTIITALQYGAKGVIPFAEVDAWAKSARLPKVILAGERNGLQLPGAELDNSPLSFAQDKTKDAIIALTTTNGTQALQAMLDCHKIVIGGFHNLQALAQYLQQQALNIMIVCAGCNGSAALEDTYFAGALVNRLLPAYQPGNDGALIAQATYHAFRGDPTNYLCHGQHYLRLLQLQKSKDIAYCLQTDIHPIVPILDGYQIRLLT